MIPIETKVYSYISCVLQSSIYLDGIGEGVEGHRILGDTIGSRFRNRRFR